MTCMVSSYHLKVQYFLDIFWPTSLPGPVRWCTPRTLTSPWWQRTALGAEGRNETGSPAFKNTKVYSLQSKTPNNHLETLHDLTRSCNYKRHICIPNAYSDGVSFQSVCPIWAHHFCRETQPWRTFLDVNPLMTISSILRNQIWVSGTSVEIFRLKNVSPWSCKNPRYFSADLASIFGEALRQFS